MNGRVIGLMVVLALFALGFLLFTRTGKPDPARRAEGPTPGGPAVAPPRKPAEGYVGLRDQALAATAEAAGVKASQGEAFLVLMEMGSTQGTATLVSLRDGTASLYLSTGGGMVGGGRHEPVRNAAKAFVAAADKHLSKMEKTTAHPAPAAGRVRFYVRTPSGTFAAEDAEDSLMRGKGPLGPLFRHGQKVLTEMRRAQQKLGP